MFVEKHTILHLADAFGTPNLPRAIDLGDVDAPMLLAQLESSLSALPPALRDEALRDLRLTVPAPETHDHGIVALPGGAIALRCGVEGVLICDPATAVALTAHQAAELRGALVHRPGVLTVTHDRAGLSVCTGLPTGFTVQACSIVADAGQFDLPMLLSMSGPLTGRVLVQWRDGGAVLWQMVEAAPILALAASVSGAVLETRGEPVAADLWAGGDAEARAALLSPGLHERVSDLLMDEVEDTLRFALADRAISGTDCMADRAAEALRLLPALFHETGHDAGRVLFTGWARAADLCAAAPDLVFLGLETGAADPDALATLRGALESEGLIFADADTAAPIPLAGKSAARLLRHAEDETRLGILLAPPAGPDALFALGETLARRLDGRVVMAAPCWGFYHRVNARTDAEAGNAIWFGMGAGLDELEWL